MADCLTLLRQYNTQKKEIVERDGLVIFDKIAWPRNARTNYLIYRPGQAAVAVKEYYTLESLLFLLKNVSLSHPMYVQRAGAQNIPVITLPDRRDLLAYLNGEVETSSSIDKSVHLEVGTPAPAPKRPNEETNNENAKKPRLDEDIQAEKVRLENIFKQTGRTKGGAITDQIWPLGSLGAAMSIEQIAAIKAKRLAKKRGTIKTDDIDGAGDHAYVDDTTKDIMSKERAHRTRATILQSSGKSFSNIFSLLQSVKARDDGKGAGDQQQAPQPVKPDPKPVRNPAKNEQGRYDRYRQEYQGTADTGGFDVKMTSSFVGMNLKSVTESVSKPRPQPNPPSKTMPPPQKAPQRAVNKVETNSKLAKNDLRARTPIIIVPAAATSVINTFNAQDFLEGYKFMSIEEKKKAGAKRQNELMIHRKRKNPAHPDQTLSIPYRITDNPLRLSPDEWKQVVAVFVAGPTWQFKGWPGLGNDNSPVDIFTRMKAYHLKFDELKCDPNIQKWDVQVLEISRNRRHLDKASILRFWETLDRFIIKHKADLRY